MAEPTKKAPEIEKFLEGISGRTTAIHDNKCIQPPLGCGKPVVMADFKNEISRREYRISGLCQKCQDEIFGEDEDA
jgi:hypothetical protein